MVANFVEVYLASEGHDGMVGINYLEKTQLATPYAIYGAMLAGVDFVLMGAGLPREIPAAVRPGAGRGRRDPRRCDRRPGPVHRPARPG